MVKAEKHEIKSWQQKIKFIRYDKATYPNAKSLRFGIVVSEWNPTITEGLFKGAYDALVDCGALPQNIIRWDVPGSFELVYGAKRC